MRVLRLFLLLFILLDTLGADEDFDPLSEFETLQEESQNPLEGFEEISLEQTQEAAQKSSALSLSGEMAFKSSYGYKKHTVDGVEYSGFNQAQSALFLQFDYALNDDWSMRLSGDGFYDAYYDLSHQNFNSAVKESYQTQLRFDDLYLQGKLSKNLDVKLGRQIVVWGKSDSIRITDVINPLDNRLPGMTDIKDLRLSTTMAKADYYFGSWSLSLMAIAESRIFLEPAPRGEFFPVDTVFAGAPRPFLELSNPKNGFEDADAMQYAAALNGVFSGWDLSFYGADVLDSRWHIVGSLPNATREVSKIQMLGSAINIVSGSWLFKSEMAYLEGLRYNSTQEKKSRFDALIGFDYMGISQSVLSFEIANRHIFGYETQMATQTPGVVPDYLQRDEVQSAFRATRSFYHERVNATFLLNMFGHNWEYGGFARASLEYDIADALKAKIGIIEYIAPRERMLRPLMDAIENNARIFADITYNF